MYKTFLRISFSLAIGSLLCVQNLHAMEEDTRDEPNLQHLPLPPRAPLPPSDAERIVEEKEMELRELAYYRAMGPAMIRDLPVHAPYVDANEIEKPR